MTIDVLSHPGFVPFIVGGDAELSDFMGVTTDAEGRCSVLVNGQAIGLSAEASENFRTSRHLLLIGLTDQAISSARKVRMDDPMSGDDLSEVERLALSKALTLETPGEFRTEPLAEFRRAYPELNAA